MTRKVIAFDLDDTLAVTKSPISDQMSTLLGKLLELYYVCVISGGKFEQFTLQVVDRLKVEPKLLTRLHLMPTCGTRYYRYDVASDEWQQRYAEDLSDEEKRQITNALDVVSKDMGLHTDDPYGEIIEDRGSQITHSALGQLAPADLKYEWAEKNKVARAEMRDKVAAMLPGLEVRMGGTTSTDVTRAGIDKAYGMKKLIEALAIDMSAILFIGDKLQEGGNDYPVKAMGIDTIEVNGWQDTALLLEGIIAVA